MPLADTVANAINGAGQGDSGQGVTSDVGTPGIGGGTGAPPAGSQAAGGVTSPSGTGAGTGSAPGVGSGATPPPAAAGTGGAAGGPASAAAQQALTLLDAARQYGFQVPQGWNEHQLLQHLVARANAAQQYEPYVQYGREYAQHRDAFRQYLSQQQNPAAQPQGGQQQAAKQSWWKAPEYDPQWRQQVYRAEDGSIRALPNTPPGVVEKYLAAEQHRTGFLEKFAFDPMGAIKPGLEEMIREQAQALIQQQFGQVQQETFTQQFLSANSSWIHARDGQGQVLRNPITGAPQLSEWGQRFKGYADQLYQSGMNDDRTVASMAQAAVERDYLMAQQRVAAAQNPQTQAAQGQAAKDAFLQNAQQNAAAAGQQQGAGSAFNPQLRAPGEGQTAQNPTLPLAARMLQAFDARGVTDQHIRNGLLPLPQAG